MLGGLERPIVGTGDPAIIEAIRDIGHCNISWEDPRDRQALQDRMRQSGVVVVGYCPGPFPCSGEEGISKALQGDVGRYVEELHSSAPVVFVTANADFLDKGFIKGLAAIFLLPDSPEGFEELARVVATFAQI